MKKIKAKIQITENNAFKNIKVELTDIIAREWCLQLFLLAEEFAEFIELTDINQGITINIAKNINLGTRAQFALIGRKTIKAQISLNELQYWTSFFGSYCAKGKAAVNHIDVEGLAENTEINLVFVVQSYDPAISPEQAEWRLKGGQ